MPEPSRFDEALALSTKAVKLANNCWHHSGDKQLGEADAIDLASLKSTILGDSDGTLEQNSFYEGEITPQMVFSLRELTARVLNDRGEILRRGRRFYEAAEHVTAAHTISPAHNYRLVSQKELS